MKSLCFITSTPNTWIMEYPLTGYWSHVRRADYPLDLHSSMPLVNLHLSRGNVFVLYLLFYLTNYMVLVAPDNAQFLFNLTSFTLTSFPVKVFEHDKEKKKTSLQKRNTYWLLESSRSYLHFDKHTGN